MAVFYMDSNGNVTKKKKEEERKQSGYTFYMDSNGNVTRLEQELDNELAPTKPAKKEEKVDFFKKGGLFEDGWDFGDGWRTMGLTIADASLSALEGLGGMAEGILDLGGHIVAGGADLLGADEFADDVRKIANHNTVSEAAEWIRDIGGEGGIGEGSVLGRTSRGVGQGIGQIGGILLTGGIGSAAGLGAAGTTALTTGINFASSAGAGISEAYNDNASDAEAWAYGTITGGINAASDLIFGGLGKGVKALGVSHGLSSADDILAKKLSSKISSKVAKTFVQAGVKAGGEGFEEVLAGLGTAAAKMIYKDGVSYQELLEDENLLEQFVVGALSSGLAQSGGVVNSVKTGTDFISGMTANEETVVNKEVEKRIAQEETNGNKLSNKEKNAIYESVVADMDKGYISTDTIEEALGGDTFKAYQDAIKSEEAVKNEFETLGKKENPTLADQARYAELTKQIEEQKANPKSKALKQQLQEATFNLAKDSRLVETYNEQERRKQAFQADVNQYEGLEKESIQKIISKGQMQNTNRAHDVVDFAVKTAAGRGLTVTTATTEEILARETEIHGEEYVRENFYTKVTKDGKTEWKLTTIPNAFIDGKEITLNVNSPRLSRALIGHEIGHTFEGTKYYDSLAKLLNSYDASVKGKEAYAARKASIEGRYKGIDSADAQYELNADLLGEYIFSDEKFVKHLTQDRNVFQKIFDEIKYMLKMATAGSQQQRDLLRIKHTFEKAWRESQAESKAEKNTTGKGDVKYALSEAEQETAQNVINSLKTAAVGSRILDGYATYTTERMAREINSASASGVPDYAKSYITWVNPIDFVYATTTSEKFRNQLKEEAGTLDIEKLRREVQPIHLTVNFETGEIVGHEGRHRMLALADAGISKAPVIIDALNDNRRNTKPIEMMKLQGQKFSQYAKGTDFYLHNMLPLSERYADVAMRAFTSKPKSNVQFALSDNADTKYDPAEILAIQNIGQKSVNSFNSNDIKATEKLAKRYWEEMGTKSPFFRAWFGDWRVKDKSPVLVADTKGDQRGVQKNEDTGWDIQVSGRVFVETRVHTDSYNIAARPYLPYINDIVKKAILLDSVAVDSTKPKSQNSLLMHSMYAVADIGNGPEVLKLYVEEMNNPNASMTTKRGYQLQNIEKYRPTGKGSQNVSPISPVSGTQITVADLFNYVKGLDKNFNPNEASKITDADSLPKIMYHGSNAQFTSFDRGKAKGSGLYGKGFYFTDSDTHAKTYGNLYSVYLNIRNPLKYGETTVSRDQVRNYLKAVAENEDYSIENYGTYDVEEVLNTVMGKASNGDAFQIIQDINATAIGDMVEAAELFNSINGTSFDGIVVPTETVAFYPEQIKSADGNIGTFDGSNADIRHSLSPEGEEVAPSGNDVPMRDLALQEDIAPVREDIQPKAQTAEEMFPDDLGPIADDTQQRLWSMTDEDAPPEIAPVTDSIPSEVADPFAAKDIKEVGQRNVKAFMSENPDIKPFFQTEANNLLGELERTVKGKRYYSEEGGYTGTSRYTSEDVAYLLDELKLSYKDIEASLKAIISGDGNINRAAIKRIEFIINDRLMKGYTDFETGAYVQPNQQYINALNQMQQMEAFQDSIDSLMEIADDIAPARETRQNLKAEIPIEHLAERPETIEEKKPILNVKQRIEAKLKNLQSELAEIERQRQESWKSFDEDIKGLKEQYNGKAKKNTQTANNLLIRIERTETRKQNTDDLYNKRINSVKEKIAKVQEEIKTGESPKEQAAMRVEVHEKIIDNIKTSFAENGFDFDEVLENAKDLRTISTVDNTPQRVLEKSLGYKEGKVLADLTVNKVAENETKAIRWLNSITDRKNGLLAQLSKQYKIKPGSKESAAAQMYAEGYYEVYNGKIAQGDDIGKGELVKYGDAELARDFPDAEVRKNIKGLARDPRIREFYDAALKAINEARARNAYPEIKPLKNYFLHFRAQTDAFSRLGIPFNPKEIKAKDLPTDLNGVTADLKPGQPFFSSSMHRMGKRTSFDLLGGLEQYAAGASRQIFHIDDIQTLRALRNYVADIYGQAKGFEKLDLLEEDEAQARVEGIRKAHLSTFAKFLNEEANVIAGKTALTDRAIEGIIGREGLTILDTINRQVGANMVGFNVSSSLTNLIAPVQAFAKSNKAAFVKAMAQTASNRLKSIKGQSDGFMENSPVAIRRKGADRFARTPWAKATDVSYMLMSAVDSVSTELVARAKYNELTSKGMDSEQAHIETDKWVSRLMGDRSLGQQPQLYNSKMLGMFTKFQLEVRNQLDAQFYDTIQEAKLSNEEIKNKLARNAKTAAKVTKTFVELAVLQHLFGKAFEAVAGYNPAFDIISAIIKTFGFDDDEDDDDTIADNIGEGIAELVGDLPYTSLITDGGRIPIASATTEPVSRILSGKDKYGNDQPFLKNALNEIATAAPYYVLPGGLSQIKKTTQGLSMFDDDLPIAGSYTDSGNLRFPVAPTLPNIAQAAVFGQYASKNARDYFDNEYAPLKEKQIQEFIDLDIPIKDYRDIREGLKGKDTLGEKVAYIATLDLPIDKKNILVNNAANREEPIDMSDYGEYTDWGEFDYAKKYPDKYAFLQANGISVKQYNKFDDETKEAWSWAYQNPEKFALSKSIASDVVKYRSYTKALSDISADKDENGKSISGSRKEKVISYINNLDADYGEKIILFKSEYPADDTYNYEIVEYLGSREDITYDEMITILYELGFTVKDGRAYWD